MSCETPPLSEGYTAPNCPTSTTLAPKPCARPPPGHTAASGAPARRTPPRPRPARAPWGRPANPPPGRTAAATAASPLGQRRRNDLEPPPRLGPRALGSGAAGDDGARARDQHA